MLEASLKSIHAFLYLIQHQQALFLDENRHEALKQASLAFRETEIELADDILAWCDQYPDIRNALRQTRQELYSIDSLTGDRIPGTKELKAPPSPPPAKISRETLLNAIQESFPKNQNSPQTLGDDKS
ncbi:MAG: hypothetical protein HC916_20485 [Coleofasciculaceae cyanobacterium SM2_1_6]|nr:hypothetical protein [Coleofasciculaceae cyanobacterium SM2_1_6]